MSKHRWRDSLRCLCENHIDTEKDEQLKQSKIEIQNKVTKVLKLVHDRRDGHNRKSRNGEGNSKRDSELPQLIEDLSRQNQLIYDLHVDLRNELWQTYNDITEEGFYTASSDSASETSEDLDHPNGGHTLKSQDQEFEDLMAKFTVLSQEKETLKEKLGNKEDELLQLSGAHEARNKEALVLIKDLEAKVKSLNHDKGRLKEQTEHGLKAINKMQMKEYDLEKFVLSLNKSIQDKDDELSNMRPRVKRLETELNVVLGKLRELEEQLLKKDEENIHLKHKVKEFEERSKTAQMVVNQLSCDREAFQGRILELEEQIAERRSRTASLTIKMEALTREVTALHQQVNIKRINEITKSQEKEALEGNLLELNGKLLLAENEASARICLLNTEMSSIQRHLSSERDRSLEKVALLEKQNDALRSRALDQQMILKQQEETIISLEGDSTLAKRQLLQAADRKMEEMAAEFRKSFEANIMILRQRIRVAEQLQTENKEIFRCLKERCSKEHVGLEDKLNESRGHISNSFEAVNQMWVELQLLYDRFDDKEGEYLSRISRVLDEIDVMRNGIKATANEMHGLQKKVAELEKVVVEKEEEVIKVGQEKKEAIRQLCISLEYHQNRCDQLAKLLINASKKR